MFVIYYFLYYLTQTHDQWWFSVFYRYQLVIEAYDSAYPDNTAITQATINVLRNLHAPVFNPADYMTRITDEHLAAGTAINITVRATDNDDPVRYVQLIGTVVIWLSGVPT